MYVTVWYGTKTFTNTLSKTTTNNYVYIEYLYIEL